MKRHPPEALRAFPPLSHGCALRAGGRSQRGGAALARLPALGPRRFHALRAARSAMDH
jgi:general secretion pathway protein J